jgi:hypothetical protein
VCRANVSMCGPRRPTGAPPVRAGERERRRTSSSALALPRVV